MSETRTRPELPLAADHRKPRLACKRCLRVGPIVGRGLCGRCWHAAKATGQLDQWPKVPRNGARPHPRPASAPEPAAPALVGVVVTLRLPPEGVELWRALAADARRQWRTVELQLCAVLAEAQGVTP